MSDGKITVTKNIRRFDGRYYFPSQTKENFTQGIYFPDRQLNLFFQNRKQVLYRRCSR
jgi:hypothetical protein